MYCSLSKFDLFVSTGCRLVKKHARKSESSCSKYSQKVKGKGYKSIKNILAEKFDEDLTKLLQQLEAHELLKDIDGTEKNCTIGCNRQFHNH